MDAGVICDKAVLLGDTIKGTLLNAVDGRPELALWTAFLKL